MAKKLAAIGSCVDSSYMIYINNDEPKVFPDKEVAMSFINEYRSQNVIFKLQLYRCDVYSL